jgi:alpha-beta hydrolase superfamily lysophospholipase
MNYVSTFFTRLAIAFLLVFAASLSAFAQVDAAAKNIVSKTADVDGVQFHYMTAGKGPAVVLIHGYAETSLMWKPIIPLLAERFTVIAPDLPG